MKSQILSLVFITAFLLSLTLVSAAISFTDSNSAVSLTQLDTSKTITITTNDLANFTITNTNANITVTPAVSNNVTSVTYTISPATSNPQGSRAYTFSILAKNATNATDTASKSITVTISNNSNSASCKFSNAGSLLVDDMEINVADGFGEDDSYLYPLDQVEAKVRVSNDGNWDIKTVEITACLLDKTTGKCVMDESDMDISTDSFKLNSGKDQDVKLTFQVDPDQLKVGNDAYTLYVSATGKINDNDAGANDATKTCSSNSEDIAIRTDDTFAVVSDISFDNNLSCGDTLELSANVWNIGDEDLADDEVYFELYSKELGINKEITFDNGIDSFEKQAISFSTIIPSNLTVKSYPLRLSVLDDNHDAMENQENDKSQTTVFVNVLHCVMPAQASITASLSDKTPTANVGGDIVVNTVIKNTGSNSATYTVSVPAVNFAEVTQIDPATFILAPGASQEVVIYMNINSNTQVGNKEFTIRATSGQSVSEQKVSLAVQEGFSANAFVNNIKTNWVIYLIVLVNLILIIAIIAVVVRIVNRD